MPSTKIRSARNKKKVSSSSINSENDISNVKNIFLNQIDAEHNMQVAKLESLYKDLLVQLDTIAFIEKSRLRPELLNTTLGELKLETSPLTTSSLANSTSISVSQLLNNTKNNTLAKNAEKKNTSDEGYLTATETRSSSTDRSRNKTLKTNQKNTRRTRSVSATRVVKHVTIHPSANTKTPPRVDRTYQLAMGTVTPKIKPNHPLSVLRRPKQGETAISLQGSPLVVSGVVMEECANVNIPLQDGRVISLQPTRGIRVSQVPEIDNRTMDQLVALRDNLNKVVELCKLPS